MAWSQEPAEPKDATEPAEAAERAAAALHWTDSLAEGIVAAQQSRKPLLVVVSGRNCPFCRLLERELQRDEAQAELQRWTLVTFKFEEAADDARTLAVGPIPALRVLTPSGVAVASRDGAIPARKLVSWLEENFDEAASAPATELTGDATISPFQAIRLVREFDKRDATLREAAIRRLLPHPQLAAGPVAAAMSEGSLATRLAALELLTVWKAPIAEIDPWRPETLTSQRLKVLSEWADSLDEAQAGAAVESPTELSKEQLDQIGDSLDRMVAASSTEAIAIRERLARHRRPLLPEVYRRLGEADTDQKRERLTGLRYRLVATDALVLQWPGGIERLAAANPAVRHAAVDELARRASLADEPLLLELFSDPEPLVREISLAALHSLSGKSATGSLVRLLKDPDANVRATVLKQLAEDPAPSLVPHIVKYLESENEPDLVVHGIRVLRETPSKASLAGLVELLKHESWRVRAEAADALDKTTGDESQIDDTDKVEAYVALVELLQDDDAFVISRAVQVLSKANLRVAIDPLAQVAVRHPELAVEVVTALASNREHQSQVARHLEKFRTHDSPKVRAAAIAGLCSLEAEGLEVAVRAALDDPDSGVRIATANSLLQMMLSDAGEFGVESVDADAEPDDANSRAAKARKKFPIWFKELVPPLRQQLASTSSEERVTGSVTLIALGEHEKALPVLVAAVEAEPHRIEAAAKALLWLPRKESREFFTTRLNESRNLEQAAVLVTGLAERYEADAVDYLWQALNHRHADGRLAARVVQAFKELHTGSPYIEIDELSAELKLRMINSAKSRAGEGSRWQRLAAMTLLLELAEREAAKLAQDMRSGDELEPPIKDDLLRVLLTVQDTKVAQQTALEVLKGDEESARSIAVAYLADGVSAIDSVDEGSFELKSSLQSAFSFSDDSPQEQALPSGLTADMLRPLLNAQDTTVVAQAGYLLCLLGESEGLSFVVADWRRQAGEASAKRLYRAVAALNDSTELPLLEELYRQMNATKEIDYSQVADFYWTIRSLTGPGALSLRKKIRDEVGMEKLRSYAPSGNSRFGF